MLVDPQRNYVLDLVNFSEDDPLLRFAAYTALCAGALTLVVGFLACCGAIKRVRCMLGSFIIFLFVLFAAELGIGILAVVYRDKFTGDRMPLYLWNMSHNRYHRDRWVTPLLDTIQYYQQCCGGHGPYDYYDSFWFITNTERGTRSFVPKSCCKQTQSARAWAIQPVDAMCTTYHYYTQAFNNSVHIQGCGKRMQEWYNTQAIIFAAVGFSFSILQLLGIVLAAIVCCQIQDEYSYIET